MFSESNWIKKLDDLPCISTIRNFSKNADALNEYDEFPSDDVYQLSPFGSLFNTKFALFLVEFS